MDLSRTPAYQNESRLALVVPSLFSISVSYKSTAVRFIVYGRIITPNSVKRNKKVIGLYDIWPEVRGHWRLSLYIQVLPLGDIMELTPTIRVKPAALSNNKGSNSFPGVDASALRNPIEFL